MICDLEFVMAMKVLITGIQLFSSIFVETVCATVRTSTICSDYVIGFFLHFSVFAQIKTDA